MSPLRCQLVSLPEVHNLTDRLSRSIRRSGYRPDLVVAIARGGFVPARFVCDFLGLFDLTSIRIRHYTSAAQSAAQTEIVHPLMPEAARGRRILIVDDVNDTGETLEAATAHIGAFGPADMRTAVLHEKIRSPVRADYAVETLTQWRWLIYPWAVVEDVGGFLREMDPRPADAEEAAACLLAQHGLRVSRAELTRLLQLLAESGETPP